MFGKIVFLLLLVFALVACNGSETQESSEPATIPTPDLGVLPVEPEAGH